jgi:predicted metal-binding membrane protein
LPPSSGRAEGPGWLALLSVRRGQRLWLAFSLAGVTALAWLSMLEMAHGEIHPPPVGSAAAWAIAFAMWSLMMVAMMLPTAAPMLLLFARLCERRAARRRGALPWLLFAAGYLAVWVGFSAGAASLQWLLAARDVLNGMGALATRWASGGLLVAVGLYQLTPLKAACLRGCQSPIGFLLTRWRDGPVGALRMGAQHGVLCAGCCWALMALMFVGGTMNLVWMAGLTAFVLVEKLAEGVHWLPALAGGALVVAGLATWLQPWLP